MTDRLATSRVVVQRLLWDPRFDVRDYTLVYEERFTGMREIPLVEFEPDGIIPWHRIWAIKDASGIVWDRKARIDRINHPDPAPTTPHTPAPQTPTRQKSGFRTIPIWRFDATQNRWVEHTHKNTAKPKDTLTVATLNVLCDVHHADRIQTPLRTRAALDTLKALDADIIALQEVTPTFAAALLSEPWAQADYCATDNSEGRHLGRFGQIILSRAPILTGYRRDFSAQKRAIAADIALGDRLLQVVAVHLTSSRSQDSASKRARQLREILDHATTPGCDALILGDFNSGTTDLAPARQAGFTDLWRTLQPTDPGYTFDPELNGLAAIMSLRGERRRFDRILLRSPGAHLTSKRTALFANTPIDTDAGLIGPLHPSDHFGVVGHFQRTDAPTINTDPTHTSALAILIPEALQAPIQAIRSQHDKHAARWMPHINLLYGFVPDTHFDDAAKALHRALALFEPFTLTLDDFDTFVHRASATLFLVPHTAPAHRLRALQSLVQATLPQCTEQSARGSGFTPHLTLAQCATVEEAEALAIELRASWEPLRFEVRHLDLIARDNNTPFESLAIVALGTALGHADLDSLSRLLTTRGAWPNKDTHANRRALLARIKAACAPFGAHVGATGSHKLDIETIHSDLDATLVVPQGLDIKTLRDALAGLDGFEGVRTIGNPDTLGLKMTAEGVPIDLLLARTHGSSAAHPTQLPAKTRQALDPSGAKAVQGNLDALALERAVEAHRDAFADMARALRIWARARRLSSSALGLLTGGALSVVAAWSCRMWPQMALGERMARTLEALSEWPWPEVMGVGSNTMHFKPRAKRDHMPIVTAGATPGNLTRNVTRGTRRLILKECRRGALLARQGAWSALFEPVRQGLGAERVLWFRVLGGDRTAQRAARDWTLGNALSLILAIERVQGLTIRPFAPWDDAEPLALGISGEVQTRRADIDASVEGFEASFREWAGRPGGVVLSL